MDAMPVTLAQELSGWRTQIESGVARLKAVEPRLLALAQGRHGRRYRHQRACGFWQAILPAPRGAHRR